jgi:exodeoxyribonuclease V beta subunit
MNFWLLDGEGCGVADYQNAMAQHCAAQIRDWLSAGARARRCCGRG